MQKYSVNQYQIANILNDISVGQIAIPEIQRPFVWSSVKVRDLMDSLYQGFPVGYIIAWKNPAVRLKDGSLSNGKKVLIDGQQRITALRAAILGLPIVNKEYKEIRIVIAFNPISETFATLTPAIKKDHEWIADISEFLKSEDIFTVFDQYCEKNPTIDKQVVQKNLQKLLSIKSKQVGFIELSENLDIETVTEIFIRINSKGVVLSQADFAMSKIASAGDFGVNLRKFIDYFCHLSIEPKFYKHISENDTEFAQSAYLPKIAWLKDTNDNLYDPDYSDVIKVAFTKVFERGKLSDLVSLLSGRNFETREYEEAIAQESFKKLEQGIIDFTNQTNFERFVMIVKSAGFIDSSMIMSGNVLNFAYILFLKLRDLNVEPGLIEHYVKRWLVMSLLTGRYSGSAESMFDLDIRMIVDKGIEQHLADIEASQLSESYWNVTLVQDLEKINYPNTFLNVFFAAQVHANDDGFLSTDITVRNLIEHRGDIHHLFPHDYLKKAGRNKNEYNQIANFALAQQEINIKIGNKSPQQYFAELREQIKSGKLTYGNIQDEQKLKDNLVAHCIPTEIMDMTDTDYDHFLLARRNLMAAKMKEYYQKL